MKPRFWSWSVAVALLCIAADLAAAPKPDNQGGMRVVGAEPGSSRAAAPEFAGVGVSLAVGTLGIGVEAVMQALDPWLNLRLQVNYLGVGHDFDSDGNDYNATLHFFSAGLLADVYPFATLPVLGKFHVTGGVYTNQNKVRADALCNGGDGCSIGSWQIKSVGSNPAHLNAKLGFRPFAPYAGIGFGNVMVGGHWHFGLDLGVLFSGTPRVFLDARGTADVHDNKTGADFSNVDLGTDPQARSELRRQRDKLKQDIGDFTVYPVATLTVGYRFGG